MAGLPLTVPLPALPSPTQPYPALPSCTAAGELATSDVSHGGLEQLHFSNPGRNIEFGHRVEKPSTKHNFDAHMQTRSNWMANSVKFERCFESINHPAFLPSTGTACRQGVEIVLLAGDPLEASWSPWKNPSHKSQIR